MNTFNVNLVRSLEIVREFAADKRWKGWELDEASEKIESACNAEGHVQLALLQGAVESLKLTPWVLIGTTGEELMECITACIQEAGGSISENWWESQYDETSHLEGNILCGFPEGKPWWV
jgi:hypothetical protein